MPSPVIHTPHDRFFKTSMENPLIAREFFSLSLPESLHKVLDFDRLSLCSSHYVSKVLSQQSSDVLYKAPLTGKETYFYLLCEHQSTPDSRIAFRLLKYASAIWDEHQKQKGFQKPPLVIPIVFYHGKRPCAKIHGIQDILGAPKLLIEEFIFQKLVGVNTHQLSDEFLRQKHLAGLMILILKHIYAEDVLLTLSSITKNLNQVWQEGFEDFVESLINYAFAAGKMGEIQSPNEQLIQQIREAVSRPIGEKIMTAAERFIEYGHKMGLHQGLERGLERGLEQGQKKSLQKQVSVLVYQLQKKFGAVPTQYQRLLADADEAHLLTLSGRIFEADSLEELFGQ